MTALDSVFEDDRQQYLLICTSILRDVQAMRAEVKSWPESEQKMALRLAIQLQDLDERIRQLLWELVPTSEH